MRAYQIPDRSSDELYHYGVKGMHWGVRRYQNSDGTLTAAGKEQAMYKRRVNRAAQTKNKMDKLYNTLSDNDKSLLGDDEHKKEWLSVEEGEYVVKRLLKEIGDEPVAAFDIMTTTRKGHLTAAIMTNPKYRGKGYGLEIAKRGVDWYEKNSKRLGATTLSWGAYQKNAASKKIAEKVGFEYNPKESDDEWAVYNYKSKRS